MKNMSKYLTKLGQLSLINKKDRSVYYRLISGYNKSSDDEKKALDDNADILIEQYLNTDVQNINKNVKTLTTIAVIYFIISVFGLLIYIISILTSL